MAKRVDLRRLEHDGRVTLSRLPWWAPELPAEHQRPQVYALLLRHAAADMPAAIVNSKAFLDARRAVNSWSAGQDIADAAGRLFHDPSVRGLVSSEVDLLHYWQNPQKIFPLLTRASIEFPQAFKDGSSLSEALRVASQFENFEADHPSSGSDPEPASAPSTAPESLPLARTGAAQARAVAPGAPAPGPNGAKPGKTPSEARMPPSAAEVNQEWATAIAAYERTHPAEDDEFAELPDSYFERSDDERT